MCEQLIQPCLTLQQQHGGKMTSGPTGYPQTLEPTCCCAANSSLFKCQGLFCQVAVQGEALGRLTAARPSSRSWRRHWLQTYEWLKCSFAGAQGGGTTFANGGGTLPSAFSGSSVTTQKAAVAASHGRACAQGHLNLIPTLLSQPMVEQHFIQQGHIITLCWLTLHILV